MLVFASSSDYYSAIAPEANPEVLYTKYKVRMKSFYIWG